MSLDREAFSDTLDTLLFGEKLPLALTYSQSSVQVSESMGDTEMMQTSIGQGKPR